MQTEFALATVFAGDPASLATVVVGGVMLVAGLYSLVGLAVTAEINRTISAIHQRDNPAR